MDGECQYISDPTVHSTGSAESLSRRGAREETHSMHAHTRATYRHKTHSPVEAGRPVRAAPALHSIIGRIACHTWAQKADKEGNKKRGQFPVKKSCLKGRGSDIGPPTFESPFFAQKLGPHFLPSLAHQRPFESSHIKCNKTCKPVPERHGLEKSNEWWWWWWWWGWW